MFIHFEDWTVPLFISRLNAKGLPHAGRIIKTYATYQDPRELIDRPSLIVLESNHSPFRNDESFPYEGRETYTGEDLETRLEELGLHSVGKEVVRSLFRFANQDNARFCQTAMAAQFEGKWLFDHPFQDLDGLEAARLKPDLKESQIHLDLFYPTSIERLRGIVNFDNRAQVLYYREHPLLEKAVSTYEGQRRGKER